MFESSSSYWSKEDFTFKSPKLLKLVLIFFTSSPSSKDVSSSLMLSSFKKETFVIATSALVSSTYSSLSVSSTYSSLRLQNKFSRIKKTSYMRLATPPFENSSSRPSSKIRSKYLTSSNLHSKTSLKKIIGSRKTFHFSSNKIILENILGPKKAFSFPRVGSLMVSKYLSSFFRSASKTHSPRIDSIEPSFRSSQDHREISFDPSSHFNWKKLNIEHEIQNISM